MKPEPTGCLIGYARVSTAEQNLDMQIEALMKAGCERQHIHVEKVSGAASHRPKLEWALESLRPGDTLVVWKMDRMARSLIDLLNRMQRLGELGVQFVSITEKIDTTTPGGRLVFHVLAAIAEFERDLIRERTRAGVKAAQARGVRFGQPPKLSPAEQKLAQKMRAKGIGLRIIAEEFDVSHSTIRAWTTGPGRKRKKQARQERTMPDISMCSDDECPSRETCYRYTATPSEFLQSYGQFGRESGADRCSYFWPLDK